MVLWDIPSVTTAIITIHPHFERDPDLELARQSFPISSVGGRTMISLKLKIGPFSHLWRCPLDWLSLPPPAPPSASHLFPIAPPGHASPHFEASDARPPLGPPVLRRRRQLPRASRPQAVSKSAATARGVSKLPLRIRSRIRRVRGATFESIHRRHSIGPLRSFWFYVV